MLNRRFTAVAFAFSLFGAATVTTAATIDLGFALDESGSVSGSDFTLAINGLADALGQVPTSGDNTYRISVVAFDGLARTIVPVTEVTDTSLPDIQDSIRDVNQNGGATAIGSAIQLLTDNFVAFGLGDTSLFNVTTDGSNNSGLNPATAASNASNAGIDGLSFEAVGFADTAALLNIAFPGTPELISDANDLPDPTTGSFVFTVDSFADYDAAIAAKVQQIVNVTDPVGVIPLPAGFPLLLGGLGLMIALRKRKGSEKV